MPKVYIVGIGGSVRQMFQTFDWDITRNIEDANLIQFVGGSDVNPALYGESVHPHTRFDKERDKRETLVYHLGLKHQVPMAGICRGGQFLNVMCGGKLYQHVDGHTLATAHKMHDTLNDKWLFVTSTHHQMMKPAEDGLVIGVAYEAKKKERMGRNGTIFSVSINKPEEDVEIVTYLDKEKKVLCFQPHPEAIGYPEMTKLYFDLLNKCLEVK